MSIIVFTELWFIGINKRSNFFEGTGASFLKNLSRLQLISISLLLYYIFMRTTFTCKFLAEQKHLVNKDKLLNSKFIMYNF